MSFSRIFFAVAIVTTSPGAIAASPKPAAARKPASMTKVECRTKMDRFEFTVNTVYGLDGEISHYNKNLREEWEYPAAQVPGFWITKDRLMVHVVDDQGNDRIMLETNFNQPRGHYRGVVTINSGGSQPMRDTFDVICSM